MVPGNDGTQTQQMKGLSMFLKYVQDEEDRVAKKQTEKKHSFLNNSGPTTPNSQAEETLKIR